MLYFALHFILLYYIILYYIVLYCIVLYCIVLYCIVLYCIVLYCILCYLMVCYMTFDHICVSYHIILCYDNLIIHTQNITLSHVMPYHIVLNCTMSHFVHRYII